MIIACKDCNGKVSTDASRCPHCGAPMKQEEDSFPRPDQEPDVVEGSSEYPDGASMAFVLGLLGIICCQILGPFAWVIGSNYEEKCRARGLKPEGLGVAGKILGIVGTIILILGVFFGIFSGGIPR